MDDALAAYDTGRTDGHAGHRDPDRADHPRTGPDYLVGVVDGQLAAFEEELVRAIRRALDTKQNGAG
jgi:hypothetical protein